MKKRGTLIALWVAGVLMCAVIAAKLIESGRVQQAAPHEDSLFPLARPSNARARVWKGEPKRIRSIPSSSSPFQLFRPRTIKLDARGDIYVVDSGDKLVKKFSREGELLLSIGKGQGSGPGEFLHPIDYDIDPQGNIWVCDARTNLVSVFRADGALARTIRVNALPYRITVSAPDLFVLMLDRDELFGAFDSTGRLLYTFGRFLREQAKFSMVLDGWIAGMSGATFVYAPLYRGMIVRLGYSGNIEMIRETIYSYPWPKMHITPEGGTYVSNEAPYSSISLSCVDDTVFVLSRAGPQSKEESTLDAYDGGNGDYLFSTRLPQRVREAVVTRDCIFSLADTSITIWQR